MRCKYCGEQVIPSDSIHTYYCENCDVTLCLDEVSMECNHCQKGRKINEEMFFCSELEVVRFQKDLCPNNPAKMKKGNK